LYQNDTATGRFSALSEQGIDPISWVPLDTRFNELPIKVSHLDLMHPSQHTMPFTAAGWLFEMKLDGFRALARKQAGQAELSSRTGRSLASEFPEIVAALQRIPGEWQLDAELVVPDDRGYPSFERLRRRAVMRQAHSIAAAVGRRRRPCACSTSCSRAGGIYEGCRRASARLGFTRSLPTGRGFRL
jgi:hypothetical protein